jgi:hypothetical protein
MMMMIMMDMGMSHDESVKPTGYYRDMDECLNSFMELPKHGQIDELFTNHDSSCDYYRMVSSHLAKKHDVLLENRCKQICRHVNAPFCGKFTCKTDDDEENDEMKMDNIQNSVENK